LAVVEVRLLGLLEVTVVMRVVVLEAIGKKDLGKTDWVLASFDSMLVKCSFFDKVDNGDTVEVMVKLIELFSAVLVVLCSYRTGQNCYFDS
jgi:hypothetical protein